MDGILRVRYKCGKMSILNTVRIYLMCFKKVSFLKLGSPRDHIEIPQIL